ncbi:MAG: hypothetical protein MJZ54_02030 [Bacteroidaceae bacterium]|nr:hypothetical protein [Bacteroidaceae bacterium]
MPVKKKYTDDGFYCEIEDVLSPIESCYGKGPFDLRAFIVLCGLPNSGKTSTLRDLIERLSGKKLKKSPKDVRCHFDYKKNHICVTTPGDTRMIIEQNCATFTEIGNRGALDICITSSRTEGGGVEMLNYYIGKMRNHISIILWINIRDLDVASMKKLNITTNGETCDRKLLNANGQREDVDRIAEKTVSTLEEIISKICELPRIMHKRNSKAKWMNNNIDNFNN